MTARVEYVMPLCLRSLSLGPLVLLVALLSASAWAQPLPRLSGPLVEVRVDGTTVFNDIVRTIVAARPGTLVDRIDLEAERNRVYALGTFEEVTVSLEDRGAGAILVVRVRENPRIAELEVVGTETLDPRALRRALVEEHALTPGRTLNIIRAEAALVTLQRIYRSVGMPFDVAVVLETIPDRVAGAAPDGRFPVLLRYVVDESAPISRLDLAPSTVLSEAELRALFAPVVTPDTFSLVAYQRAVEEVARRYAEAGFRQSGVDLERTELLGGVLDLRFLELRIVSLNTAALGIAPGALSLAVGDLFNYDVLLEDVRRLAAGRSADVRVVSDVTPTGGVRVTFVLGAPATAGPITAVRIEGNSVFDDATLEEVLVQGVGDTFTSLLAEEDFRRLVERYAAEGYVVANRPSFNWLDGTYVQRIAEQRIAAYEISYDGPPDATEPWVITRYLPRPGEVLNLLRLDEGLRTVARVGAVTPVSRQLLPTDDPNEVVVNVVVSANQTGLLQPAAQYNTETGFSASVSFTETNLWGRAHNASVEVEALTSDLGLMFGGSVRYAIPWLYLDAFDFQEVPTSFGVSLFSVVTTNQRLTLDGSATIPFPGLTPAEEQRVSVGEYTVRSTGLSLSVGRRVLPFTDLLVSARGAYNQYMLEPGVACIVEEGALVNQDVCSLPESLALEALPQSGLSAFTSAALGFDNRDNPNYPTRGIGAVASVGFGWGNDIRDPETAELRSYTYQQLQVGAKTYLRLSDLLDGVGDPNHVFAARLNAGHQFGGFFPETRQFVVGRVQDEATLIRGYLEDDFNPSRTYFTGSLEYRYDFALDTFATETIIAIVFADVGYASSVPGFEGSGSPLFGSVGVGVQINLGFAGVALPAIRFDYGFSERNPTGVFNFRIGPVF
jgi:outer membrane protein insertion porin family